MKDSVLKYGGFYIGRFEASNGGGFAQEKKNTTSWNNIAWGDSVNSIGTKGAVYYSKNMASYHGYINVQTTLIYGVQWDSALRVISQTKNVTNSDSWGNTNWQYGGIKNTGSNENWKAYNIYDLCGNLFEWTMEGVNWGSRTARGGNYQYGSNSFSAASRWPHSSAGSSDSTIGFRVSMYIK